LADISVANPGEKPGHYLPDAMVIREGRREWHQMEITIRTRD